MLDHVIPKPASLRGYAVHRLVEGLTEGSRALFTDCGDHFLLRTSKQITANGSPLRKVNTGDVVGFELRACVAKKTGGKRSYYPISDWRSRHEWLRRKGDLNGFEVLSVHCTAEMSKIDNQAGRQFTIDRTDFIGVLRVVDVERFHCALEGGVGTTGRAFGFGMLII